MDTAHDDLAALIGNPDLQRAIASDPVLDALEKVMNDDGTDDRMALIVMLGGGFAIDFFGRSLPVPPPSAGLFALLWSFGSPFCHGGSITRDDALLALYAMLKGRKCVSADPLAAAKKFFAGMVKKTPENPAAWKTLCEDIDGIFTLSLRPYRLLPGRDGAADVDPDAASGRPKPRYDAEWLANLTAAAAIVSGIPADRLIWDQPLLRTAHWYVEYVRLKCDGRGIGRKIDNAEAINAYGARVDELLARFAAENNDTGRAPVRTHSRTSVRP